MGTRGCCSFALASFFTGSASFWLYLTAKQGQATGVGQPRRAAGEDLQQSAAENRACSLSFPSLPFQKDISQREKSSGGCSPSYPGEKRWTQLKHDFACWNLLSQEQKIKFHSWVFMPRCLKDELSLFLKGFLQAVFRNPAGQSARHPSLREAANGGETRYYMNKNRTKLVTPTGSGDMFSQQSWFSCSQLFLLYGERQRVKFCLTYQRFLV